MEKESISRQQLSESPPRRSESAGHPESRLSKDTLFAILEKRRDALQYLKRNDGGATLSDLAEHIAARENDVDVAALSSDERKRVYIALYQCHLPKMATAGIIDFDKNRGDVALRSEARQLDTYLEEGTETTLGGARSRNLAVAGGLAAGLVASTLGVPGFELVPELVWATLSTGMLVALTVLDARRAKPAT